MKKRIGILSKDFRTLYKCSRILRELGVAHEIIETAEKLKDYYVILTTENIDLSYPRVIKIKEEEIDARRALTYILTDDKFHVASIGIDPGERIGMAIIGNNIVLEKRNAYSVEAAIKTIRTWMEGYPAENYRIKIGNGSPYIRNEIIKRLFGIAEIEMVDENSTSKSREDYESAVIIARLEGKVLTSIPEIRIKEGSLKEIQKISRIRSEGKVTISRKLAFEVLYGRITLEEAINRMLKD